MSVMWLVFWIRHRPGHHPVLWVLCGLMAAGAAAAGAWLAVVLLVVFMLWLLVRKVGER